MQKNFLPSMVNEHAPQFQVLVDEANLGPGAIFGEEYLRGKYEVSLLDQNVSNDIILYFWLYIY